MDNLKEILKNYTKDDYAENKINLHIHTVCSDGEGDAEQIIKSAKLLTLLMRRRNAKANRRLREMK